jgi:UDP-glucose 4-epimerase
MKVLITGGTGFIGSHLAIVLSQKNYDVLLFDNFSNSSPMTLERLKKITGKTIDCVKGNIEDFDLLKKILCAYQIDVVIHCAGLKSVTESVSKPLHYYNNNVSGSLSMLSAMASSNVKKLIFSSSATVYGLPQYLPLDEQHPISPTNPYGNTKAQIEAILKDLVISDPEWKVICLRYFNPVGAHESGLIGENPNGIPNNLMPHMAQVAFGDLAHLSVYGNDYQTYDGTGVRDFIHVMDLAEGHLAVLSCLDQFLGWDAINLGTGRGCSVIELMKAFEQASSKAISFKISPRRDGDIAQCYANVDKAFSKLGWKARFSIADMCKSTWIWTMQSHQDCIHIK